MNKKILMLLMPFIVLQNGCVENNNKNTSRSLQISSEQIVSIEVKVKSFNSTKANFILFNNTDNEYIFGDKFELKRKNGEEWMGVSTVIENYAFSDKGYILCKKGSLEFDVNWKWLYGKLDKGEYRLIKEFHYRSEAISDVNTYYITIDFAI